ncbi:MAG: fumarylacetoacetate hydrolase family protein [Hyphomicrobiales bacterium]
MRLATFEVDGRRSYGVVEGDTIVDAGATLSERYADLKALIAGGDVAGDIGGHDLSDAPRHALSAVVLKPTIPNPDKVICVGLNYETHRKETGRDKSEYPVLFTRFANSQVGHGEPMILPTVSDKFDFEGELAVIIGRGGRHIAERDGLSHVAGYACYNDGTLRDWQRHTHQFIPGKNFPGTGAFGPWMVTPDDIPDPTKLELTTRLNGEVMQNATTDLLIFTIPYLIHYCSDFTELVPGDVIVTGTPGGVGFKRNPPLFMKAGDRIEVEISGIGTLANDIRAEAAGSA